MRTIAYPTNFLVALNSKIVDLKRLNPRHAQCGILGSKLSITALGALGAVGGGRRHTSHQT
jgi:hypothetical protein